MTSLIIVNYAFSQFRGGGENFDLNLASQADQHGVSASILTVNPIFGLPKLNSNEYNVRQHYTRAFWLYSVSHAFKHFPWPLNLLSYPIRLFGQISFEFSSFIWLIFHQHLYNNIFINYLPILALLCDLFLPRKGSIMRMPGPLLSPVDIFICKYIKCIISNGNAFNQINSLGFANNHFVQVGIDHSFLDRVSTSISKDNSDELSVAVVGRLVPIKQNSLLLDTLAQSSLRERVRLNFYGDGPELQNLISQAHKLSLSHNVCFHGHLPKSVLNQHLATNNCLVLFSSYDNFPNCLLEANAIGLPVFGFNVGGIPDIIIHKRNGFLCPYPLSLEMIADQFDSFLRLVISGHFYSHSISSYIRSKYSWSDTYTQIIKLYGI